MSDIYGSYEEAPRPLTDRERKLLKRMFSDFFEVPSEWKAALKAALEQDPPILGIGTLGGGLPTGFLIGEIRDWPFAAVPDTHWAFCDGQSVLRTLATHKRLHDKVAPLGYPAPFGPGDGSTTWTLPNLKGRVRVHKDAGDADFDVVGETRGAKTHTLAVNELASHSHDMGQHRHNYAAVGSSGSAQWGVVNQFWDGSTLIASLTPSPSNDTSSSGSNVAHNNIQPSIVIPAIIYLG
jgi:microcystin-dependent protein